MNRAARFSVTRTLFLTAAFILAFGARPAAGQRQSLATGSARTTAAPEKPPGTPSLSTGAATTTGQGKAGAGAEGGTGPGGSAPGTTIPPKQGDGQQTANVKCPPHCVPKCTEDCTPSPAPPPWLVVVAFVAALVLMVALHLYDSWQGYRFARESRDKIATAVGSNPSPEQLNVLASLGPTGIPGTTRSIFTYGLLALLGAAVFYLLAFGGTDKALEYADKILTVLAGAVSSIIGFYFGTKATTEGVKAGAGPRQDAPPTPGGKIVRINPPKPHPGEEVAIEGTGFGDSGTVQFITESNVTISAQQTKVWKPNLVTVEVPKTVPAGKIVVAVNPSQGARILAGNDIQFEVVPP